MHTRSGLILFAVILILILAVPYRAAQADSPTTPPKWAILTPDNIAYLQPIKVYAMPENAAEELVDVGFDSNSRLIALFLKYEPDSEEWRDVETGQVISQVGDPTTDMFPVLSPGGRQYCLQVNSDVSSFWRCFDLASGEAQYLIRTSNTIMAISWDDKLVVFPNPNPDNPDEESLRIWSLSQNRAINEVPFKNPTGTMILALAFSPDGHSLYAITGDFKLVTWNLETREQVGAYPIPDGVAGDLTVSPRGDLFASSACMVTTSAGKISYCSKSEVVFWDSKSQQKRFAIINGVHSMSVAFSPDGRYVALMVEDGPQIQLSLLGVKEKPADSKA